MDGLPGVDHGPLNRLFDPPGGVGAEPHAGVGVEFLHGPHQPEVAFGH